MAAYMMRDDVRKALHVEECPSKTWPFNEGVGFKYTKEYDACNEHVKDQRSMIDFYKNIVPQLKIAWVYNGKIHSRCVRNDDGAFHQLAACMGVV